MPDGVAYCSIQVKMTSSLVPVIGRPLVPGVKCLIHPPAGSSQMILFTFLGWKIVASDFPYIAGVQLI